MLDLGTTLRKVTGRRFSQDKGYGFRVLGLTYLSEHCPRHHPTLLPHRFARTKSPEEVTDWDFGTCASAAPANASCKSPIRSTRKEKPLLRSCSTFPSSKNAPLWCST